MLISPVGVLLICVGHAFEWTQQQAAAAWFVFCVARFGVWCGAGYGHVLGHRIQRAARPVEMTVCARHARPSLRYGHVLGLRIGGGSRGGGGRRELRMVLRWQLRSSLVAPPTILDYIAAFSTQCASATPRGGRGRGNVRSPGKLVAWKHKQKSWGKEGDGRGRREKH